MYLKSLTLKGFKSFADKTHMVYDPGLTVVVGPNGSGKSNVSDAILWVLGEQSARMLRGQAMEDVIFSGSSARQPVGVAEVTLVLDNSDHTIPVDFTEVGITRRMYRSGESEYLINGAPARLMDIQDVLHDSGLGKDTHSIISQGKLDAILQSRPEERRELIEEAAGISKHRRRKERSQRKLKSMDENLHRAKDIAREINRQLRPLERQVDKAKRANDVQNRLSELTTLLAVDDLRALQREWTRLNSQSKESDAELELARYRLDEKQAELEKLQSMLEQKGLFVGDLGDQRRRMQDALGRINSDMRLLEEKGKNMVAKLSDMRMNLSSLEKQKADRTQDLDRNRNELANLTARFNQLDQEVSELGPKAMAAREELREVDGTIAQITAEQRAAQRISDQETVAYARLKEQISNAELEDSLFVSRLSQLDETIAICDEALAERTAKQQELTDSIAKLDEGVRSTTAAIEAHKQQLSEATTAEEAARQALSEAKASLAALDAVERTHATANPLVARLLNNKKTASLIDGRLSDCIEVPQQLEALVERLLSDDVSALVTSTEKDLSLLIDQASQDASHTGHATLVNKDLSASSAAIRKHNTLAPACPADGTMLLDQLTITQDAQAVVAALLGNVCVCPSAQQALEAHKRNPLLVYATVDGTTVLTDGRVLVGTASSSESGSLERKRSIRTLQAGMDGLEHALVQATAAVEQARTTLSTSREELDSSKSHVALLKGELSSVSSELGRLQGQRSAAQNERAQLAKRREEATQRARQAQPQLDEHKTKAQEAAQTADALTQKLQEVVESREGLSAHETKLAAQLSEARLQLATVRERKRHLETNVQELERRLHGLESRHSSLEYSARSLEVLRLRVQPLHERYSAIHDVAMTWASRLQDRASLAEADSESLKKTINDARAQVTDAQKAYEQAQVQVGDLKVCIGKLEVQVEQAIQAIVADGSYTLEDALELPEPEDREADEREVASLKRQLADIGPVNQVAMDEYTKLKTRSDYIGAQVEDLEAARSALVKITAAIERKMRKQFLLTFDTVNKNFQQVFAMLFPGGKACLEMTDPDHLSETGIEIVAQPRGKRITKMMLMSGGEKSLTALALLFAVYRTRTVPFYVFDEVEAALDDSNLDKLLGAIEQLKEHTQLIVISHQRRTMEQADVLYGVSMQADGVSHVVSQRLDHATGKVVDA
ncbi:MAG: chromosome segregation protein SMC [Atopobium sp.]|uniref:chromosome segregation protein SMC n=2 Tax=Atopobium sp. TaxID=1872650 RepID=UPI002A75CF23|nr:chromosome segregation protein SMC [Atopobium sp.]MDY2788051.1 chromosome segregation protein SMC [Atopobium sp.]